MTTSSYNFRGEKSRYQKTSTIETTLYDLIETVSEELKAGEDYLVPQIVFHLVNTGKLRFIAHHKDFKTANKIKKFRSFMPKSNINKGRSIVKK